MHFSAEEQAVEAEEVTAHLEEQRAVPAETVAADERVQRHHIRVELLLDGFDVPLRRHSVRSRVLTSHGFVDEPAQLAILLELVAQPVYLRLDLLEEILQASHVNEKDFSASLHRLLQVLDRAEEPSPRVVEGVGNSVQEADRVRERVRFRSLGPELVSGSGCGIGEKSVDVQALAMDVQAAEEAWEAAVQAGVEPSALKVKLGLIKAAKQEQKARDDACTVMQIAVSMSPLDVDVEAAASALRGVG